MVGIFINMGSILIGSFIGLLVRSHLKEEYRRVVFTAIGIVTLLLGVMMMFPTQHIIYLILALIAGGIIGSAIKLEEKIENLGKVLYLGVRRVLNPRRRDKEIGNYGRAFLEMSVLFCSGSLAILGSFEAGAVGDLRLLLIKSALDGSVSVFFVALLGPGVMLSVISVFLYQGSFFLLGRFAGSFISYDTSLILSVELGAVGGALLVMIGMRLLDLREEKVGNFLPALVFMALLVTLGPWVQKFSGWLGI